MLLGLSDVLDGDIYLDVIQPNLMFIYCCRVINNEMIL